MRNVVSIFATLAFVVLSLWANYGENYLSKVDVSLANASDEGSDCACKKSKSMSVSCGVSLALLSDTAMQSVDIPRQTCPTFAVKDSHFKLVRKHKKPPRHADLVEVRVG